MLILLSSMLGWLHELWPFTVTTSSATCIRLHITIFHERWMEGCSPIWSSEYTTWTCLLSTLVGYLHFEDDLFQEEKDNLWFIHLTRYHTGVPSCQISHPLQDRRQCSSWYLPLLASHTFLEVVLSRGNHNSALLYVQLPFLAWYISPLCYCTFLGRFSLQNLAHR